MRKQETRLAVASFVVAGGFGFLAVVKGSEVEWGTAGEWAGGFGTLLAFGVTLRLLFIELGDRRDQRARQEQEQARLVSAWLGVVQRVPDTSEVFVEVLLRNRSEEPVYDSILELRSHFGEDADSSFVTIDLVPPGETYSEVFQSVRVDEDLVSPPPVILYFLDAAGQSWRRDARGRLAAIAEEDRPPVGC